MSDSPSEEIINSFRKRMKKHQEVQTDEQMSMFDQIESDLNRVRLENLKLQKFLKQAQDNLAINSNNHNNTSSKFMLPSEFKSKYEAMVKESLPCAFVSLFDQPKLLVQVIQNSALYISQYVKKVLEQKTQNIAKIIGIQSNGLIISLLKLYQDNYLNLLEYDEQILPQLKQYLKSNINNITQWIDDEDNADFVDWIKQYWLLMSYVQLSDQELTIGFDQVQYEIVTFTKNEYYNIDGFGKEGMKCLVILPTIMRKQQPFNGIKQSILILPPDFDRLTLDMQLKVEDLTQELKTYNSPKQMTSKKESISELQCQQQQQSSQQQQQQQQQQQYNQQQPQQSYVQESQFRQPEQEQPKIFFSQRSDQKEVCDEFRIKAHQKQPRKSMLREMRDTLKQLNTFNDQSLRDIGKVLRQNQQKDDSKKQIQQTLQQTRLSGVNNWQKILQSKQQNKENSQMNQSQNTSFHGFTIQQLIKKIQIDGSKPLIKKGNLDQKFIKSFCQSQQISDRRTRAQSNECKYLKGDDLSISPYRIYKL